MTRTASPSAAAKSNPSRSAPRSRGPPRPTLSRDTNGFITFIDTPVENLGGLRTSGLDFDARGTWNISWGKVGFTFSGTYDLTTGEVRMVKQYVGKHMVLYVGQPDGEGSIAGTWSIGHLDSGSFLLRPVIQKPSGDEPIQEIG